MKNEPFRLADLVRLDDVGMIQPRGEARFVEEHLAEAAVLGEVRAEALDDDQLVEARAGRGRHREEHVGHPAPPERPAEHLVAPNVGRGSRAARGHFQLRLARFARCSVHWAPTWFAT